MTTRSSPRAEESLRRWLFGILGAGLIGTFAPVLVGWDHLPDPLATHWGRALEPNGAMSKTSHLAFSAVMLLIGWTPLLALLRRPRALGRGALSLALATGLTALMVGIPLSIARANFDQADWRSARLSALDLVLVLAVPHALGVLAYLVLRRQFPSHAAKQPAFARPLDLAPAERAYWSGSASNPLLIVLAAGIALFGVVIAPLVPHGTERLVLLLAIVPGVLLVSGLAKIRLTVDERALTLHYGQLGWPRQRIPIERVRGAGAYELLAMDHGGWGYRGSLKLGRSAAVVVRSGPALRLELTDGSRFAITVDDAATAARLVNTFVERLRPSG